MIQAGMLMSAPNGGKVEGNFTAQELDSIMKNHENKFMKVRGIKSLGQTCHFRSVILRQIDRFYTCILGQGQVEKRKSYDSVSGPAEHPNIIQGCQSKENESNFSGRNK